MSHFQCRREDGHSGFYPEEIDTTWEFEMENLNTWLNHQEYHIINIITIKHHSDQSCWILGCCTRRGTFQNSGLVLGLQLSPLIEFNGGWVSVTLEVAEAFDWGHWGTRRISVSRRSVLLPSIELLDLIVASTVKKWIVQSKLLHCCVVLHVCSRSGESHGSLWPPGLKESERNIQWRDRDWTELHVPIKWNGTINKTFI